MGADTFVLASGDTSDIRDFVVGTDSIQLETGLSFADLTIVDATIYGLVSTAIKVTTSGKTLALLEMIDSSLVDLDDLIAS
ncbi:MAG: hypothetical protein GDA48_17780 [Hormoscilla sp. GM102CHS1]|nr:hypothetical protein [Hormoscilla sp. GM102CHS1]